MQKGNQLEPNQEGPPNNENEFEIESLLKKRRKQNGTVQYKVRWMNYDSSYDQWIDAQRLSKCKELVREWEQKQQNEKRRKKQKYREQQNKKGSFQFQDEVDKILEARSIYRKKVKILQFLVRWKPRPSRIPQDSWVTLDQLKDKECYEFLQYLKGFDIVQKLFVQQPGVEQKKEELK